MDPHRRALLGAMAALASGKISAQQAKQMNSKNIPSTGESLPVIGLGTWQTFDVERGKFPRLQEVLKIFTDRGARIVDSSPMYGASEEVAGRLIADLGIRDKLFVATKVWTSGRAEGVAQMEDSFRKLRVS